MHSETVKFKKKNTVSNTSERNSQSEDAGKFRNMYKLSASVYNALFFSVFFIT